MMGQKRKRIDFYFDFISPYAYFAWPQALDLVQRFELELHSHPIVFGKLLDHWGQLGPAEIEPKRQWLFKTCMRYAALNEVPFNPPPQHPFNPLSALRVALPQVCGDKQKKVISAIFKAVWADGRDVSDLTVLQDVLTAAGMDSRTMLSHLTDTKVKQALISETQQAIDAAVFGVPAFKVDGELFWGSDQIEYIELLLSGNDPLDRSQVMRILKRGRGIDRKKIK